MEIKENNWRRGTGCLALIYLFGIVLVMLQFFSRSKVIACIMILCTGLTFENGLFLFYCYTIRFRTSCWGSGYDESRSISNHELLHCGSNGKGGFIFCLREPTSLRCPWLHRKFQGQTRGFHFGYFFVLLTRYKFEVPFCVENSLSESVMVDGNQSYFELA